MRRATCALLLLAACSRERANVPPADTAPPAPYRVFAIAAAGRVDGIVRLPDGARAEDVVVWMDDIRAGKPLPVTRRFEIDHDHDALVPRVQAAIAGGTLNVRNADDRVHHARFTLLGGGGAPAVLLGVVEETGAGQVVPAPKLLARAGLVAVTCDDHPETHGWIRVFDQPYFAQADSTGRFAMDSVPPGRWHLAAWHPTLGERTVDVVIDSAGLAFADVRYLP